MKIIKSTLNLISHCPFNIASIFFEWIFGEISLHLGIQKLEKHGNVPSTLILAPTNIREILLTTTANKMKAKIGHMLLLDNMVKEKCTLILTLSYVWESPLTNWVKTTFVVIFHILSSFHISKQTFFGQEAQKRYLKKKVSSLLKLHVVIK